MRMFHGCILAHSSNIPQWVVDQSLGVVIIPLERRNVQLTKTNGLITIFVLTPELG